MITARNIADLCELRSWGKFKDKRELCREILRSMFKAGFTEVQSPESVSRWTDEEIDDFLVNYGDHYLKDDPSFKKRMK